MKLLSRCGTCEIYNPVCLSLKTILILRAIRIVHAHFHPNQKERERESVCVNM